MMYQYYLKVEHQYLSIADEISRDHKQNISSLTGDPDNVDNTLRHCTDHTARTTDTCPAQTCPCTGYTCM